MKKICTFFLASAFFLNACNNDKKGWSDSEVRSFNKDCNKEMAGMIDENKMDDFCSCLRDKFQDKYPSYSDFNRKSTEEDGSTAAKRCMSDLGLNNDNNDKDNNDDNGDNGGDWSSSEKRQWMNLCTSNNDVQRLGEEKATNYCECVLNKMQERFSSLEKADASGGRELGTQLGTECARELGYK